MNNPSIYVFYGTETYLIKEQINKLINKLIPFNEREMNVINYDLLNISIQEVIEEAETLPFFSKHKLIIAKNAYFLTGQKNTKASDEDLEHLMRFLTQPVEYSTIIFHVDNEKLDERKKIVKLLKEKGYVKSFTTVTGVALLEWIKKTTLNNKAKITDKAAELLIITVGQDLLLLSQEILKMAIYVGEQGLIDEKIVEELSSRTMEQNIFSLIEKVANVEIEQALQLLDDLLKNKEEPIKIIILLARQFRLMLYAKELADKGYSGKQIASQLEMHPYAIKIALQQSAKFNHKQLQKILKRLSELDYEIKSGVKDKVLALEMFIFYLKNLMRE